MIRPYPPNRSTPRRRRPAPEPHEVKLRVEGDPTTVAVVLADLVDLLGDRYRVADVSDLYANHRDGDGRARAYVDLVGPRKEHATGVTQDEG